LADRLLQVGAALSLLGVAMGSTLDYLALRRTRLA
jgi:PAT family beta-lactamase induction signal transducer AmpG